MIVYHGSQRWDGPPRLQKAGKGKSEYGSGLYLTTSITTARRYARGGGKVIVFEVSDDLTWANEKRLPVMDMLDFVENMPRLRKRREIARDLVERHGDDALAVVLGNLLSYYGALVGDVGPALASFFVAHEVDAEHVQFSAEDWVVLYNLDKIESFAPANRDVVDDAPRVRPSSRHPVGRWSTK